MEAMINEYIIMDVKLYMVSEVNRDTDTFLKRVTAERLLQVAEYYGAEVVYNHADYRLVSRKVLEAFSEFKSESVLRHVSACGI